jgi:hypothetical protein
MILAQREREKYAAVWSLPQYHNTSPGKRHAELFGRMVQPERGLSVLDIGCGAGEGGKALKELHGLNVEYLDQVKVGSLAPFIEQPLWKPITAKFSYGYCCDVMEHIPTEFTMLCVRNMLDACEQVFFSISFQHDHFGAYVGEALHLTVKPFTWWRDCLGEMGQLAEARDLMGEGVFLVRKIN